VCIVIARRLDICMIYPFRNVVHRHEPPVTSTPVKVLLHDVEREFIVVDKPGSIVRSFAYCNPLHTPLTPSFTSRSTLLEDTSAIPSLGF